MTLIASVTAPDWVWPTNGRASHPFVSCDHYSITVQAPDLLKIAIVGFWDLRIVSDFARDLEQARLVLPSSSNDYFVLYDVTQSALQSQLICAEFVRMFTKTPTPARAIALLTYNPVSRMQARRLIAGFSNTALFESEDQAMEWLAAAKT